MWGMEERFAFKFIQKTAQIAEYRGDFVDDSLVRVEFAFEQVPSERREIHYDYSYHYPHWPPYPPPQPWVAPYTIHPQITYLYKGGTAADNDVTLRSTVVSSVSEGSISGGVQPEGIIGDAVGFEYKPRPAPDEGITVPGSDRYVSYYPAYIGPVGSTCVIILQLRGTTPSGVVVGKSVTVKDKLKCSVCGASNRSDQKFCGQCGTNLSL
jgi:hypothetical protein